MGKSNDTSGNKDYPNKLGIGEGIMHSKETPDSSA